MKGGEGCRHCETRLSYCFLPEDHLLLNSGCLRKAKPEISRDYWIGVCQASVPGPLFFLAFPLFLNYIHSAAFIITSGVCPM